jgi:transposase
MPKILYSQVIEEDPEELKELEKYHRYSHLFQRVRMLRLLKSEECSNLGEVAQALGYSWRQCQRWFASYREGGLEELLKSRVHERGRQELVTPEAFEDLEEAMKRGEVATISQADEFLRERHGIEYSHPDGVGQLLRRRKVKLKTGRPRHEKADPEKQEAFKKLRWRDRAHKRAPLPEGEAAEGDGLRRGAFRAHQLAHEALLPERGSPTLRRETRLQVDLPLRGGGAHNRRELLSLPAWDGRRMPGDLPRPTLENSKSYPDHHLLIVLDGAPSHRSESIVHPQNISLLMLPPYSPEMDPAERWFQEFRRKLSNRTFESVTLLQEALTRTLLVPYRKNRALLKRLTGYSWWVEAVQTL